MGLRPPFETFKGPTCKGSIQLGNACGVCEKCVWERRQAIAIPDERTHTEMAIIKSFWTVWERLGYGSGAGNAVLYDLLHTLNDK